MTFKNIQLFYERKELYLVQFSSYLTRMSWPWGVAQGHWNDTMDKTSFCSSSIVTMAISRIICQLLQKPPLEKKKSPDGQIVCLQVLLAARVYFTIKFWLHRRCNKDIARCSRSAAPGELPGDFKFVLLALRWVWSTVWCLIWSRGLGLILAYIRTLSSQTPSVTHNSLRDVTNST